MQLTDIYHAVDNDFEQVNAVIHRELTSDVPLVEHIASYIVDSGGKRLRPLVTLLTGHALAANRNGLVELAVIIEFLHTATLLHDDVVDTSELRRGRPTANTRWGNGPSVLVGDFLYSRAFQLMVRLQSLPVMNCLADATNVIAEGEVLQLLNIRNPDVTPAEYFRVIQGKTAMLFAAATESAARLSGASDAQVVLARDYGVALGMAFQVQDDVLDYSGDTDRLGKNIGDDLAEGKVTLPLIYALEEADTEGRGLIRKAIREGNEDAAPRINELVSDSNALPRSVEQAERYRDTAIAAAAGLPESPFRDALTALAHMAVSRDH